MNIVTGTHSRLDCAFLGAGGRVAGALGGPAGRHALRRLSLRRRGATGLVAFRCGSAGARRSTTTTRSSTTSCSTSGSSAPSPSSTATTRCRSTSCVALEPDAVLVSPGPGSPDDPEDVGVSNDAIRAFGDGRRPRARCVPRPPVHRPALRRRVVRAPQVMHGKTSQITHDGEGVFRDVPEPVHRHPLPLAGRRARLRARRARGHAPSPRTAWSWACATVSSRSKACSSTPSRSSPRPATPSSRNFLA